MVKKTCVLFENGLSTLANDRINFGVWGTIQAGVKGGEAHLRSRMCRWRDLALPRSLPYSRRPNIHPDVVPMSSELPEMGAEAVHKPFHRRPDSERRETACRHRRENTAGHYESPDEHRIRDK